MRVLVTGSRGWLSDGLIRDVLADLPKDSVIVHGGASGVDLIAGGIARSLGLAVEVHPAEWDKYGKRAGMLRNNEMLDSGIDLVLAFWDGTSRGTKHAIDGARKRGLQRLVYTLGVGH